MTLQAGKLRESVTIQRPVKTQNSYGETSITWETFANRRAAISGIVSRESVDSQQVGTVVTHDVSMRYVPGLSTEMRLVWSSRTPARYLDIVSATELNNREEHRLTCAEQV